MIDRILRHTPNCSLRYQRYRARGAPIIWQESSHADDNQHDMFLRPTPIQWVIWIAAWLRDQDCMAVWCELESLDKRFVGYEGDIDYVAFRFTDLVEVGLVGSCVDLGCRRRFLSVGGGGHFYDELRCS